MAASVLYVKHLWPLYRIPCQRNDSFKTDRSRAEHLGRILGHRPVRDLSVLDVDTYRGIRETETTKRGTTPSSATIDRELELLNRMVGYAVQARLLPVNPLKGTKGLIIAKPNTRESIVDEAAFERLLAALPESLRPIITVAYQTGARIGELQKMKWSAVDFQNGCFRLAAADTKTEKARVVAWTEQVRKVMESLPRDGERVFNSANLRKAFVEARTAVGMPGLWVHDLRRSFVTLARRKGLPESIVMRFSGHKTRSVFDRYNIVEEKDLHAAAAVLSQPVVG